MNNNQPSEEKRAARIAEMAQEIFERESAKAQAEGILQAPDMASVFAAATAMTVLALKEYNEDFASDLAGHILCTMMNILATRGVLIPKIYETTDSVN